MNFEESMKFNELVLADMDFISVTKWAVGLGVKKGREFEEFKKALLNIHYDYEQWRGQEQLDIETQKATIKSILEPSERTVYIDNLEPKERLKIIADIKRGIIDMEYFVGFKGV